MANHYDEDGNLLVSPSGRAYSDPIRLTTNNGQAIVLSGTTAVCDPIDRQGYNSLIFLWRAGTMSSFTMKFSEALGGVYNTPVYGFNLSTGVGQAMPLITLSSATPYRELTPGSGNVFGTGMYVVGLCGLRFVQFTLTGTSGQTLAVDVVLATL